MLGYVLQDAHVSSHMPASGDNKHAYVKLGSLGPAVHAYCMQEVGFSELAGSFVPLVMAWHSIRSG